MLFDDDPATYIALHCYLYDMPDFKNWINISACSAHSQRFLPQKALWYHDMYMYGFPLSPTAAHCCVR